MIDSEDREISETFSFTLIYVIGVLRGLTIINHFVQGRNVNYWSVGQKNPSEFILRAAGLSVCLHSLWKFLVDNDTGPHFPRFSSNIKESMLFHTKLL